MAQFRQSIGNVKRQRGFANASLIIEDGYRFYFLVLSAV